MHVSHESEVCVRGVLLDSSTLRVQMILKVTARKSKDFSHGRGDRFHDCDVRVLSSLVLRQEVESRVNSGNYA